MTTDRFTAEGEAQTIADRITKDLRTAVAPSATDAAFASADTNDVTFYASLADPNGPTQAARVRVAGAGRTCTCSTRTRHRPTPAESRQLHVHRYPVDSPRRPVPRYDASRSSRTTTARRHRHHDADHDASPTCAASTWWLVQRVLHSTGDQVIPGVGVGVGSEFGPEIDRRQDLDRDLRRQRHPARQVEHGHAPGRRDLDRRDVEAQQPVQVEQSRDALALAKEQRRLLAADRHHRHDRDVQFQREPDEPRPVGEVDVCGVPGRSVGLMVAARDTPAARRLARAPAACSPGRPAPFRTARAPRADRGP